MFHWRIGDYRKLQDSAVSRNDNRRFITVTVVRFESVVLSCGGVAAGLPMFLLRRLQTTPSTLNENGV
jgi:hypothetical protein